MPGVPATDHGGGDPAAQIRWMREYILKRYRHGGPGAGWYRTTTQGWQPITDTEAANERYEDMRHFMSDPREADGGDPRQAPAVSG